MLIYSCNYVYSGALTEEEKEGWIEKAGAAYAGAKEIAAGKQAALDGAIDDNAPESLIDQARQGLDAAKAHLKKAEAALDAAYQLNEPSQSNEQSSIFDGEENDESQNISFNQCAAGKLEGSYQQYLTQLSIGQEKFTCKNKDCLPLNRNEAAESIEINLNYLDAAERQAREKLTGNHNAASFKYIVEKDGVYDFNRSQLCQSLEALKERCAVSRGDIFWYVAGDPSSHDVTRLSHANAGFS